MSWTFSSYMLPSLLAGLVSAIVAGFVWRRRNERTARPFVVLMVALSWWAIAYGIELGYNDVASIILWDKIAFVGSVAVPAAVFLLAVEYAGFDENLPTWTPVLLLPEPLITLIFVWTYPDTNLIWESVTVTRAGGVALPTIEFGVWYWVNYAYSFLLIGAGLAMIGYVFVRGSRIYRRQSTLLLVGAVVPLAANLVYNLFPELNPVPYIDLTTFAMTVTGWLYGLALFRFQMLDFTPIARDMVLGEVGDGFVVVDTDGALVEGNQIGRRILEQHSLHEQPLSEDRIDDLSGQVITTPSEDVERSYELRSEPVSDFRNEQIGILLIFRDITELAVIRRHEQRISVMNRILRHNIRNGMNVIHGYSELLTETLSGDQQAHAEKISQEATELISLSEKAHHIGTEFTYSPDHQSVDVVPIVEACVEDARATYPAGTISLVGDDSANAHVVENHGLETAITYLIENAFEHNDTNSPTVTVAVHAHDDTVDIAVEDDGPGIPSTEQDVLTAGIETPLEHGSGLGLWIVSWLVSRSNGTLSFEDNTPRGTIATIHLPLAY